MDDETTTAKKRNVVIWIKEVKYEPWQKNSINKWLLIAKTHTYDSLAGKQYYIKMFQ